MRKGLRRPGNANLYTRGPRSERGRAPPYRLTSQGNPTSPQPSPSSQRLSTRTQQDKDQDRTSAISLYLPTFFDKISKIPPRRFELAMKLEDYLKTRNITDDSTDEEIRRAVDIKMFGVTFSRYLSNSSTTPEDFRSALEFIELIGYTDKLILPGQTYKVFITSKALARRINLDPVPVLNVESPTTPSQAKFKARQEEKDHTPRASMLSFHDPPSPRMMFGEPDSPPIGEISPLVQILCA